MSTSLHPCTPENVQLHSHRCGQCGRIWHHRCPPGLPDEQLVQAHTCPGCGFCGFRPWSIFRGEGSVSAAAAAEALIAAPA